MPGCPHTEESNPETLQRIGAQFATAVMKWKRK